MFVKATTVTRWCRCTKHADLAFPKSQTIVIIAFHVFPSCLRILKEAEDEEEKTPFARPWRRPWYYYPATIITVSHQRRIYILAYVWWKWPADSMMLQQHTVDPLLLLLLSSETFFIVLSGKPTSGLSWIPDFRIYIYISALLFSLSTRWNRKNNNTFYQQPTALIPSRIFKRNTFLFYIECHVRRIY